MPRCFACCVWQLMQYLLQERAGVDLLLSCNDSNRRHVDGRLECCDADDHRSSAAYRQSLPRSPDRSSHVYHHELRDASDTLLRHREAPRYREILRCLPLVCVGIRPPEPAVHRDSLEFRINSNPEQASSSGIDLRAHFHDLASRIEFGWTRIVALAARRAWDNERDPVESASALIDEKIKELRDWRGKTLAKVREIIHKADPEIVEEWKWKKSLPRALQSGPTAVSSARERRTRTSSR